MSNHITEPSISKRCPECGEEKPLSEFYRNKAAKKDGLQTWCKICMRDYYTYRKLVIFGPFIPEGWKQCKTCYNIQPSSSFSVNRRSLSFKCKTCWIIYRKERANTPKQKSPQKVCIKCKILKPHFEFSKNNDMKDGLHNACKECDNNIKNIRRRRLPIEQKTAHNIANIERMRFIKTAPWANKKEILKIYMSREWWSAFYNGEKMVVDHIIPLKAKTTNSLKQTACGLHVETNLQVITYKENSWKNCYL